MGETLMLVWYFDDYGKKESILTEINMSGLIRMNKQMLAITDGEWITTLDLEERKGEKARMADKPINFLQLTSEIRKKYNMKELGEETILGKPCRKLSIETTERGERIQMHVWVWKGLQLKSETYYNNQLLYLEVATHIKENVPVPADKFEIPADIVVQ